MNPNEVHQKIAALVAAVSISGMDTKLLCNDDVRQAFLTDDAELPRPFFEFIDFKVSLCYHDVELSVRCSGTLYYGHYTKIVLNKDKVVRALLFVRKTVSSIKELLPVDASPSYLDIQDIRHQIFLESGLLPQLADSFGHVFRHCLRMVQKPTDTRALFSAFTATCILLNFVSII